MRIFKQTSKLTSSTVDQTYGPLFYDCCRPIDGSVPDQTCGQVCFWPVLRTGLPQTRPVDRSAPDQTCGQVCFWPDLWTSLLLTRPGDMSAYEMLSFLRLFISDLSFIKICINNIRIVLPKKASDSKFLYSLYSTRHY